MEYLNRSQKLIAFLLLAAVPVVFINTSNQTKLDLELNLIGFDEDNQSFTNQVDGLATDSKGAIYATGFTCPSEKDCRKSSSDGKSSVIYIKKFILDEFGRHKQVWVQEIVGMVNNTTPGDNNAYDLAVDMNDNVIINGTFQGVLKYTDANNEEKVIRSYKKDRQFTVDAFVAKLNSRNGNIQWINRYGGKGDDGGNEVETDNEGNIIATMTSNSPAFFVDEKKYRKNAENDTERVSTYDGFIVKLNTRGKHIWTINFDGSGSERLRAIEVDGLGNVFAGVQFVGEVNVKGKKYNTNSNLISGGAFYKFTAGGELTLSQQVLNTDQFSATDEQFLKNSTEFNIRGIYGHKTGHIVCGVFTNAVSLGFSTYTNKPVVITTRSRNRSIKNQRAGFVASYNTKGKVLWADVIERPKGGDGCEVDGDMKNNFSIIGTYSNYFRVKHYDAKSNSPSYRHIGFKEDQTEKSRFYQFSYTRDSYNKSIFNIHDLSFSSVNGQLLQPEERNLKEGGTIHVHPITNQVTYGIRGESGSMISFGNLGDNVTYQTELATEVGLITTLRKKR